jgi:hypothetical protein
VDSPTLNRYDGVVESTPCLVVVAALADARDRRTVTSASWQSICVRVDPDPNRRVRPDDLPDLPSESGASRSIGTGGHRT